MTALTNAFAATRSGTLEGLRDFVVRQCARYRAMLERGLGQWYGAVVDGEIAAALGVVRERELGRFQLVGTDPRFGRRGVCSTLVHDTAQLTLARPGITTLVMNADATYHAAKVYESVGFHRTETLMAVIKSPPESVKETPAAGGAACRCPPPNTRAIFSARGSRSIKRPSGGLSGGARVGARLLVVLLVVALGLPELRDRLDARDHLLLAFFFLGREDALRGPRPACPRR